MGGRGIAGSSLWAMGVAGIPDRQDAPELWVCQLGVVPYREALALQHELREARQSDVIPDVLLLLEHPPVYTRGRRTEPGDMTVTDEWCAAQGIDVVDVDRGGKVTYHGPGQLVGYPVMRIGSVREHVRAMERAMVAALADEGIEARTRPDDGPDYTGVWAGEAKIGAIGVHVQRRVTTHGFAINVDNDLSPFGWVVACGLPEVTTTSVAALTGRDDDAVRCLRKRVAWRFAIAAGRRQRLVSETRLRAALDRAKSPAGVA